MSLTDNEPIQFTNEIPIEINNEITNKIQQNLSSIEERIISISKYVLPAVLSSSSLASFLISMIITNNELCSTVMNTNTFDSGNATLAYTNYNQQYNTTFSSSTIELICDLTSSEDKSNIILIISDVINMIFSFCSILYIWLYIRKERLFKQNQNILITSTNELLMENHNMKNEIETLSVQLEEMSQQYITTDNSPTNNVYHPYNNMDSTRETASSVSTKFPSPVNIV